MNSFIAAVHDQRHSQVGVGDPGRQTKYLANSVYHHSAAELSKSQGPCAPSAQYNQFVYSYNENPGAQTSSSNVQSSTHAISTENLTQFRAA